MTVETKELLYLLVTEQELDDLVKAVNGPLAELCYGDGTDANAQYLRWEKLLEHLKRIKRGK